ncbi:MAG TPA: hypothetical protein PLW27_01280, partial [Kiritimatiellia bacterium]|nr:hypothetical protein [Kiritimatiellia bacterium]
MKRVQGALALLCAAAMQARAERVDVGACYAEWAKDRVTVGNAQFERAWVAGDAGLVPVSFVLKNPDTEWFAGAARQTKAAGTLAVKAESGRRSAVGAEGLRVAVTVGRPARQSVLWIFPAASGALVERSDGERAAVTADAAGASGIEVDPPRQENDKTAAGAAGAETFALAPQHLRAVQVALMDQTDNHNELVWEREWLLMPNEAPFTVQGCVLIVENALDGSGLAFLKLAPLPHARQQRDAADFAVHAGRRTVSLLFNGYPVAALGYRGGRAGRTRALHAFQRCLREVRPGRDGLFLSNTWG